MGRPGANPLPVLILGAGSFAEEVADLIEDAGDLALEGFVDTREEPERRREISGRRVLALSDAAPLAATHALICALGSTAREAVVQQAAALGFSFATVIHPTASVSRSSVIGEGTVISRGAILAAHSRIGRHVIVNRGVLLGHHSEIGDFCTLSPGANIAAQVTVGSGATIGMGALILEKRRVGTRTVVGAGAVVTWDVPDGLHVFGVPARAVKGSPDTAPAR